MAGSVNRVILIGNLGQDPEIRTFANGGKIATLRIATSETWKDKNSGERKERTEWHSVVLHAEHAVGYAEQYLAKGSKVYIEGKLETRKWQDQSGADRYSTEVTVRPFAGQVLGLDSRGGGEGDGGRSGGNRSGGGRGGYDDSYQRPDDRQQQGGQGRSAPDFDDEIPF